MAVCNNLPSPLRELACHIGSQCYSDLHQEKFLELTYPYLSAVLQYSSEAVAWIRINSMRQQCQMQDQQKWISSAKCSKFCLWQQEAFEKCWDIRHCEPPHSTCSNFYIAIHQVTLLLTPLPRWAEASYSNVKSMSTTTMTTRDRGERYGPIEWAQLLKNIKCVSKLNWNTLQQQQAHSVVMIL